MQPGAFRYNGDMLRIARTVALGALAALIAVSASAAQGGSDTTIDLLLQSMVISVDIPLPMWDDGPEEWGGKAPRLTFLKRSGRPELGDVYRRFFSDVKKAVGSEPITTPAYGRGTRHKGPRLSITKPGGSREGVSFYLDEYPWGFEYVNNLVETPTSVETAGSTPANRKYSYKFTEQEGIAAAKKYIDQLTPGTGPVSGDFAIREEAWFEHEKGRLFTYRLTKLYRGVPLVDDYIQVAIDGDKNLANVSYFWSKEIEEKGSTYTAIDAGLALQEAKRIVLDEFENQPPPLTLFGVKLAYINYRKNPQMLLPVWLFDCRWSETRRYENPNWDPKKSEQRYIAEVIEHKHLVAVDAFFMTMVQLLPADL